MQREKFTSPPPSAPVPDAEFMPNTDGNEPKVIINGQNSRHEESPIDKQRVPDEELTQNDINETFQSTRKKKSKKKSKRKKQPEQDGIAGDPHHLPSLGNSTATLPPLRGAGKLPPLSKSNTSTA